MSDRVVQDDELGGSDEVLIAAFYTPKAFPFCRLHSLLEACIICSCSSVKSKNIQETRKCRTILKLSEKINVCLF